MAVRQGTQRETRGRPTAAEVMHWLKRALVRDGLTGRPVRQILVDADPTYLRSPYRRQLEPTGTVRIGDWRPDLVCVLIGVHNESTGDVIQVRRCARSEARRTFAASVEERSISQERSTSDAIGMLADEALNNLSLDNSGGVGERAMVRRQMADPVRAGGGRTFGASGRVGVARRPHRKSPRVTLRRYCPE